MVNIRVTLAPLAEIKVRATMLSPTRRSSALIWNWDTEEAAKRQVRYKLKIIADNIRRGRSQ